MTQPGASEVQEGLDAKSNGLRILAELGWGQNEDVREIDEDLWHIVTEMNFGTIWSRPGLSLRDRELITIAVLVALGARGVGKHFQHAHAVGLTRTEVREAILQTLPYAGLPKALQAMSIFREIEEGNPPSI